MPGDFFGCEGHHFGGGAVVHGQLDELGIVGSVQFEDRGPVADGPGLARLVEVADDGQGQARAPAGDGAPLHGGDVLGFVDHDVVVVAVGDPGGEHVEVGVAVGQLLDDRREELGDVVADDVVGGPGPDRAVEVRAGEGERPVVGPPVGHLQLAPGTVGAPVLERGLHLLGEGGLHELERFAGELTGAPPAGRTAIAGFPPEQFGELVEQGDIAFGESGIRGPPQEVGLGVVQDPLGRVPEPGGRREQLAEDLRGRQLGPHPLAEPADRDAIEVRTERGKAIGLQSPGRHVGSNSLGERGGEEVVDPGLQEWDTLVVGAGLAPDVGDDLAHRFRFEPQDVAAAADLGPGLDRLLEAEHGAGEHMGHARVTLDPGHVIGVPARDRHVRADVGGRRHHDLVLTQRRHDIADVAEERVVRSDEEHRCVVAAAGELVEQVRRPVERHRGLAGARATLDHGHASGGAPDDAVLVGLDGADDVRHPTGARGLERGQERSLADEVQFAVVDGGPVDDLVVEADQLATAPAEVAPPLYAHGVAGPGAVERFGGRCAPVDDHRVTVLVRDRHATDVERAALLAGEDRHRCDLRKGGRG